MYELNTSWVLWYHSLKDTTWTKSSYKQLFEINTLTDYKLLEGCQDLGAGGILCATTEVIKRGRDRHENIAIISNATKQNQRILISTLSNCLEDFDKNAIDSPALLVIGKNVLLSPILNWHTTDKRNINFLKQNKKNHEQYNFI